MAPPLGNYTPGNSERLGAASAACAAAPPSSAEPVWPAPQEVSLFNSQGAQLPRDQLQFIMSSEYDSLNAASYCNDGKVGNSW